MSGGDLMAIVERERQLTELVELHAAAECGQGQVALIDGGVASGKTELASAITRHAADAGALVLTAAGSRAESTIRLGIIGQLCHSARSQGANLTNLPDFGTEPAGPDTPTLQHDDAQLLDGVCQVLLDVAADRTLVLAVDDVQFADSLSLQALLYLQRRIRAARVLLVLSGCVGARPAGSAFRAELTRQPHCRHLRLLPLSRQGVDRLLASRLAPAVAAQLAAPVHILSGGSPVLVHALADDYLAAPSVPAEPVVGDSFVQTALACLHRSDPRLLDVARAIAVLGPPARPDLVAGLTDLKPAPARAALGALAAAGLTDDGNFPHPAVRAAVLEDCPPEVLSCLRLRAAQLLHEDAAAPATEVAAHLVAAGEAPGPWASPVLVAAAEEAVTRGAVPHAVACLELALSTGQADVEATLLRVLWHGKPAGVPRHLPSLRDAALTGRLGDGDVMMLARSLAWHGRVGEAAEVLAPLGDLATHPDPDVAAGYRATREWLHHCAPEDFSSERSTVDYAEQVLQRARVGESVLVAVWQALRVLIHAGRLDRAADWCERLHEAAEARAAVGWRAVLSDVRAAIALRRGELVAAERHARAALSTMSAHSWGIAIGSPLAHLVLACTMTGKLAQAEEIVWQATPAAMRQSLFWPAYLRARGVYYDAADRPHAALADFQAAGEHVVRWHADDPSELPWRVDLARVHVNLGRTDAAREILAEHLALADGPRTKGMGLRALASSCPPKQRQAMLREAVDLLHASGDRYELAHAFADLSETGHALGEFGRAKMMGRRAMQLAESCHAEPLRRKLQPVCAEPDRRDEGATSGFDALSDAERRVVNLAARGHTNREIGNKLFITVSTVEQHLTRAYRKLNISRRTDLVPVGPLEEAYA